MPATDYISIYVTAGSKEEAQKIARTVVEKRLAACANVSPIESIYWWKGKVQEQVEYSMLLKTRRSKLGEVIEAVRAVHSYDVPCIVALPILAGHQDYLKWIAAETPDKE